MLFKAAFCIQFGVSWLFLQSVPNLITSFLLLDENVLVGNFCVRIPGTQSVP